MIARRSTPPNSKAMTQLRDIAESPRSRAAELMRLLDIDARSLADTLREIHGGRWNVMIDHESTFVFISQMIED